MSNPSAPREPSSPQPHRVARTDQYLATAQARLDKLLGDYATAVAEDGLVSAVNNVALAMRIGFEHVDVAWIAVQAIQRLHAMRQETADDEREPE
jgi:hypothetical protein